MPLKRLERNHRITTWRGVEFWMADEAGILVFCRVSHEALRYQATRNHFGGHDGLVFDAYQDLLEQVVSDTYDSDACNEAGCIIVHKEALERLRPKTLLRAERTLKER
jgi:hypothetical protein